MIKNYGLVLPKAISNREEGAEHILGAEEPIINLSGVWNWLQGEPQRLRNVETYACTVFGTIRGIETLIKFKTGIEVNYLKRYLANVAKFKGVLNPKIGANPHDILELIRKVSGLLKEGKLVEWDESVKTSEDYYNLKDIELLIKEGQEWWNDWTFNHKWIWNNNPSPEEKQRLLKDALKTGTVCVSVVAWKERNGFYYKEKGEKDSHWTGLERYDGERPIIEDSYPESEGDFEKTLEPNYDFNIAKVFFLTPTPEIPKIKVSILQQIVEALKKVIELFIQKKKVEEIKTLNKITVPEIVEEKTNRIPDWGRAIQVEEGWWPNSVSYRHNNPGNLKFTSLTQSFGATQGDAGSDGGYFCKFPTYEKGFTALCDFLELACLDKLKAYHQARTLLEFTKIYANPPNNMYASRVAEKLQVPVNIDISELL